MAELFKCPICDNDDFEDLDYLRIEKVGFCICRSCGFETYHPSNRKYETEENLLDFYRYEYRRHPNAENIITSNRKLGYLLAFFGDMFSKNKNMKVLDIGSATGYFLAHLKVLGLDVENLYGSEYTVTFRNFSKNYYGLKHVYEEVPKDVQFDFILLNHVLEHMHEPDKKLEFYKTILKDDGVLSLWVPTWHDVCFDSAKRVVESFEDLYNVSHINTWSERGFLNLLNKTGWKVVRQDRRFYGFSVILKKGEKQTIFKEDYKEIIDSTIRQRDAISLHYRGVPKNKEALDRFPKYPDAIIGLASYDNKDNFQKKVEILTQAIQMLPHILELRLHLAHVYWQWKKYNESIDICTEYARLRVNDDIIFELMAKNFVEMGQFQNAIGALNKAAMLNPTRWVAAQDMIGNLMGRDWSKAPVNVIRPIQSRK